MQMIDKNKLIAELDIEFELLKKVYADPDSCVTKEYVALAETEYKHIRKIILDQSNIDIEIQPVGSIKEYDNGMVAMRKETFKEYEDCYVTNKIRRGEFTKEN